MTNKEAIEILNNWDMACPICEKRKSEEKGVCIDCRFSKAINLAIKALEECAKNAQGDLISREALMPLFMKKAYTMKDRHGVKLGEEWLLNYNDIKDVLDNAPTVEPCYQTISCLDCKMYDKENHHCPRFCEVIKELVNEVEERPQGEWIEHYDNSDGFTWPTCSRCMFKAYEDDYKFCPNCGAEMRKEKEDE